MNATAVTVPARVRSGRPDDSTLMKSKDTNQKLILAEKRRLRKLRGKVALARCLRNLKRLRRQIEILREIAAKLPSPDPRVRRWLWGERRIRAAK